MSNVSPIYLNISNIACKNWIKFGNAHLQACSLQRKLQWGKNRRTKVRSMGNVFKNVMSVFCSHMENNDYTSVTFVTICPCNGSIQWNAVEADRRNATYHYRPGCLNATTDTDRNGYDSCVGPHCSGSIYEAPYCSYTLQKCGGCGDLSPGYRGWTRTARICTQIPVMQEKRSTM